MKTFIASAFAGLVAAYDNSVPIYGTYPGWELGGNKTGIQVQFFMDLLCSGCS